MTSTRDNPGAFTAAKPPGLRPIVAKVARKVMVGAYQAAALGLVADSVNLLEVHVGAVLRPRFRCTCCGHVAHAFRHLVSVGHVVWNSACPRCGSRSRHRGLAILLPRLVAERRPRKVLHFAPEPVLRACFASPGLTYETADLHLDDVTHTRVDIQRLRFVDRSYDLVLCNHVLEHVPDDVIALAEIARVLSSSGVAVITVPGNFTRAETLRFSGDLPNGHYRDYGLDFVGELRGHFARVEVIDLHQFDADRSGLSLAIKPLDTVFVCHRS